MAPIPLPHGHLSLSTASSQLEEGRTSEKTLINTFGQHTQPVLPKRKSTKMFGPKSILAALLVGCLVVVGLAHTDPDANNACSENHRDRCIDATVSHDKSALSRLIDSASPEALHRFLHTVTSFQHGVFDSDQAAVKAVLEIDPALSSTVAQLQRRQSNSTTTDRPTVISNTETTTTPTEQPTTPTTVITTTTDPTPTTVQSTTTANQDSTTAVVTPTSDTVVVPPTTTTDTSPLPTTTTTTAQSTTTAAATSNGQSTTIPAPTTNPTMTTATSKGPSTTAKPTSKTSTYTSTLPGGAVTTVTSITVYTPGAADSPTGTTTGDATLQSGAAVPGRGSRGSLFEVLVGGAVAAAMLT